MWKQHKKKISPRIDIEFWPPWAGVSIGACDHFVTLAENFIYEYPFVVRARERENTRAVRMRDAT